MVALREMEITQFLRGPGACFVAAKYPEWNYEYNFVIQEGGRVLGKTSAQAWVDVSQDTVRILHDKLNEYLYKQQERQYSW